MNAYNGYSGDQRNRAQRWLNMIIASGKLLRPTVCMACGQSQGVIDMHAEAIMYLAQQAQDGE